MSLSVIHILINFKISLRHAGRILVITVLTYQNNYQFSYFLSERLFVGFKQHWHRKETILIELKNFQKYSYPLQLLPHLTQPFKTTRTILIEKKYLHKPEVKIWITKILDAFCTKKKVDIEDVKNKTFFKSTVQYFGIVNRLVPRD